jgi:hypothetical protein
VFRDVAMRKAELEAAAAAEAAKRVLLCVKRGCVWPKSRSSGEVRVRGEEAVVAMVNRRVRGVVETNGL